jgi:NitT/TauT family transport system substrate-binding protein
MRHARTHRSTLLASLAILLIVGSGCGTNATTRAPAAVEHAQLVVATLPVVDNAALFIAIKKGYFAQEGLTVTTTPVNSGPQALTKLDSGAADIIFGNYVSDILAVNGGQRLRVISDGYAAAPNAFMLTVPANSPIHTPAQLAGKRIAVNATNNIGALLTLAALKPYGVTRTNVTLVTVPFPDMARALTAGTVDAAWITEPALTQTAQQIGADELLDTASGPTAAMPIAGYATTQRFSDSAPMTVAAFQRALRRAALDAADRREVENIVPAYIPGITAQTTALMALGSYPATLSRTRLQRVADLMTEFGLLTHHLDVTPMLP